MTRIKICGVKTIEDALLAAQAGADMVGFNFYRPSPRYITPDDARRIGDHLRNRCGGDCPLLVGVFVNPDAAQIAAVMERAGLDFAQLSGDESPTLLAELRGRVFKAIRPADVTQARQNVETYAPHFPANPRAPSLLLDAGHPQLYGGTGEPASIEVALAVREIVPRMILAGGLTPENVAGRIAAIRPWGVDVASGMEVNGQRGKKEAAKVRAFIAAARQLCPTQ